MRSIPTIRTTPIRRPGPARLSRESSFDRRSALRLTWASAALADGALLQASAPAAIFETWAPARTGIAWPHESGRSPRRYQPESIGPGIAIFDYNNDGWMDLYFPNSGPCDFFQPSKPLRGALYRNNGDGTFTDVAAAAGVAEPGLFALGASTA